MTSLPEEKISVTSEVTYEKGITNFIKKNKALTVIFIIVVIAIIWYFFFKNKNTTVSLTNNLTNSTVNPSTSKTISTGGKREFHRSF